MKTLRTIRKDKGIMIKDIAKVFGVSRQTIHKWETGANLPTLRNLPLLESVYGEEFIDGVRGTLKEQGKWKI